MRVQLKTWECPMEVGLSIGNRWGQSVDFTFDKQTLSVIEPKKDDVSDSDIKKALDIKEESSDKYEDNRVKSLLSDSTVELDKNNKSIEDYSIEEFGEGDYE